MAFLLSLVRDLAVPALIVATAAAPVAAFSPFPRLPALRSESATAVSHAAGGLRASAASDGTAAARRHFLQIGAFAALGTVNVEPASAKRASKEARQLFDDEGNPETIEERKARYKREREAIDENRKAAESKAKTYEAENGVANTEMGSNLRGDYYYPTARKRY